MSEKQAKEPSRHNSDYTIGLLVGRAQLAITIADFLRITATLELCALKQQCAYDGKDWDQVCQKGFGRSGGEMALEMSVPITISGHAYDQLLSELEITEEVVRNMVRPRRSKRARSRKRGV